MKTSVLILLMLTLCTVSSGLAQWQRLALPEIPIPLSGSAVAIDGSTIFLGTYRSSIYRSTTGGAGWANVDSGLTNLYWTESLLEEGDTVFAGAENGVYRTTNRGDEWTFSKQGFPDVAWIDVRDLLRWGSDLLAAANNGVFRSSDNALTWSSSSAGTIGDATSLASVGGTLFAGSMSGIYRSTDNGHVWSGVFTGRTNTLLADNGTLYAGTNGIGLWKSTNGGSLWIQDAAAAKNPSGTFYPIYALARAGAVLYVGTQDGGIFRKSGSGAWGQENCGLPPYAYIQSLKVTADTVYAAVQNGGLYRLAGAETCWTPVLSSFAGKVDTRTIHASGGMLFLGASSNSYNGAEYGSFRSADAGGSWLRDSLLSTIYLIDMESYGDSLYAFGSKILFSSDHGDSWSMVSSGLGYTDAFIKTGNTLYAGWGYEGQWGEYGGLNRSTDNGSSWHEVWSGDTAIYALAMTGDALFAGGGQGIFRSTDGGISWTSVSTGIPAGDHVYSLRSAGTTLFASTGYGLYRSTNAGSDWVDIHDGLPLDAGWYGSVRLLVHNGVVAAGTKSGVYTSTDNGASWAPANDGWGGSPPRVLSLAFSFGRLYAATNDGLWSCEFPLLSGTAVRVRFGWNMLSLPVSTADPRVTSVFPAATSDAFAYAGDYTPEDSLVPGIGYWLKFAAPQHVFVEGTRLLEDTLDVAPGWNMIGSPSVPVAVASIMSSPGGIVTSNFFGYEGTFTVAESLEAGEAYWVKVNQAGRLILSGLASAVAGNRIVIVPTAELPPAPPPEGDGGIAGIGEAFSLAQNYPNPFNPSTTLRYYLPAATRVTLAIYNHLGQMIETLVDGDEEEAGFHEVVWERGPEIPTGVYYCRLRAHGTVETRKLVLLK